MSQNRQSTRARPARGPSRAQLARQRTRRRQQIAAAATVAVVIAVGVLFGIKLSGGKTAAVNSTATSPKVTGPAPASVLSTLASVSPATLAQAAKSVKVTAPKAITAPALTAGGKPKVLYIGAEYCPFCAAERWPVVLALSQFGTFSGLGATTSSAVDVFPNTQTFSFHGATYTSSYLTFSGVETTSNQVVGGSYGRLDTPTPDEQTVFQTYDRGPYVSGSAGSIPFVDLGGRYIQSGAAYSPGVLAGKGLTEIADSLPQPTSRAGQDIDAAAGVITADLCQLTGNQPAAVCALFPAGSTGS